MTPNPIFLDYKVLLLFSVTNKYAIEMKMFRSITMIINYKIFIVISLAVIATGTSDYYNYNADMPITLIDIAIVFPIVFAINSAYIRRETALQYLADFKAHSVELVYAARDWGDESYSNLLIEIKNVLINLYSALEKNS